MYLITGIQKNSLSAMHALQKKMTTRIFDGYIVFEKHQTMKQ